MYCLVKDGQVLKYPYHITDIQADNPTVSFTVNATGLTMSESELAQWGIFIVQPTFPNCDPITHFYKEITPEFKNGVWYQAWEITENSPELITENRLKVADFIGFYDTLIASSVYQKIRTQALTNLPLLLSCTEFIAAFTDAKAGRPNRFAIQACIHGVVSQSSLDDADLDFLNQLLQQHRMAELFTLG